ncbi:unnamed protein product [Heligmosomoides polygyrus]|uniref:Peptidase A2 domain-containing protein n=1 Tax=Heligmosomoides polygyrus TaxID=6339 RepID=A0A3P8BKR7_HELPZ|nr:unnamed protein product [Heligmosomoides polygyrus]
MSGSFLSTHKAVVVRKLLDNRGEASAEVNSVEAAKDEYSGLLENMQTNELSSALAGRSSVPERSCRKVGHLRRRCENARATGRSPIEPESFTISLKRWACRAIGLRPNESDLVGEQTLVDIQLLGMKKKALLDTGSQVSIMPLRILEEALDSGFDLDREVEEIKLEGQRPIYDASGNPMRFKGAIRLNAEVPPGRKRKIALFVMDGTDETVLLGTNALRVLQLSFDAATLFSDRDGSGQASKRRHFRKARKRNAFSERSGSATFAKGRGLKWGETKAWKSETSCAKMTLNSVSTSLSRMVVVYVLIKHRGEAPMAVKRILGYDIIGQPVAKVDYTIKFRDGLQPTIELADYDMLENVVHRCEKKSFKMTKWRDFFEKLKSGSRTPEQDKVPAPEESETSTHKESEILNFGEPEESDHKESEVLDHHEPEGSDHKNSKIPNFGESLKPDDADSETLDDDQFWDRLPEETSSATPSPKKPIGHSSAETPHREESESSDNQESETPDFEKYKDNIPETTTSPPPSLKKAIGHTSPKTPVHEESESSDNQESGTPDSQKYKDDIPEPTTSATTSLKKAIGHNISTPQDDDKGEQFVLYKYNQ